MTRFADRRPGRTGGGPPRAAPDPAARATVVVAPGDGLAELFRAEGAAVVGGNPSTEEILDAIRATGAGRVVVLPNDPNARAVAAAAAREAAARGRAGARGADPLAGAGAGRAGRARPASGASTTT